MTETITIRGNAILRRSNQPENSSDFRFIVRWMLADESTTEQTIRLPRVVVDPRLGYVSDRFRVRIYRRARRRSAREYFDFAAGDFVAAPSTATETIVAPILDALVRPRSRKRWIRDGGSGDLVNADTREALWCVTSNLSLRAIHPVVAAPEGGLDSAASGAGGDPERLPLAVGDLLFGAEAGAARGQVFLLLRDRVAETLDNFDLESLLVAAGSTVNEAGRALRAHFDAEAPARLALALLALGGGARFNPMVLLEALDSHRRDIHAAALAGSTALDIHAALVDCAIMGLAISPRLGERQGEFLGRLSAIAEQTAEAREHLALSSVHGGRWFVYNSSGLQPALGTASRQTDAPLGQAAGPELVGLGFVSDPIGEARVRQWATEGWHIGIEVEIESQPPVPSVADAEFVFESDPGSWSSEAMGRIWERDAARHYLPFDELVITRDQLGLLAAAGGSTTKPLAATSAELFLDAVQLNPHRSEHGDGSATLPDKAKGEAPSFSTGDTAIQLLFAAEADQAARGVNVYAVWEGAAGGDASPGLAALRPWLVNVRHSFLTEIYHAAGLDSAGVLSPEFATLIAHPPSNPVLPRPAFESFDEQAIAFPPARTVLPDEPGLRDEPGLPDLDIYLESPALRSRKTFHHDLRDGSELPSQHKDPSWARYEASLVQTGVAWDPSGLVDEAKRARDLPMLAWRRNIDRYRLFVTATDMFGQESEPVTVNTQASFMSQNGVPVEEGQYRPVSRLPVLDPPTDEPGAAPPTRRLLAYDRGTRELVVDFSTPFDNRVETGEGSALRAFMPASEVEAEIIIFRRFIRPDDLEPVALMRTPFAGTGAIGLDQAWLEHIGIEAAIGYKPFYDALVPAPMAGDAWRFQLLLQPRDHGYRYKAAIRFRLTSAARKQRFPDELRRRFHHFVPPEQLGGSWKTVETFIPEMITRGRIGVTGMRDAITPDLIPVPPLTSPGAVKFETAKPIGAVPGVNRDQLLAKLLSNPVAKGGTVQPSTLWPPLPVRGAPSRLDAWDGRRFAMTLAQIRMIEAALDRVPFGTNYSPVWRPFIEMLAMGFAAQVADEPSLASLEDGAIQWAPIIGLRGALQLEWTYSPVSEERLANLGALDRVDAAMFAIFEAHVPDEITSPAPPSTIIIQLEATDPAQPISFVQGNQADELPRFFVLRNRFDGSQFRASRTVSGGVEFINIEEVDRERWRRVHVPLTKYDVFAFQPAWTMPVNPLEPGLQTYSVIVPVGGGEKETVHWIVQSQSSAQVAAPETAYVELAVSTSVTPPPIALFASEPVRDPDALWLVPGQNGFYPSAFESNDPARQLRVQPRMAMSWHVEGPSDAGLLLFKEARSLWPTAFTKDIEADEFKEAIERIAALAPGAAIELADLGLIDNWLRGHFNWSGTSSMSGEFWPLLPRLPQRHPRFLSSAGLAVGGSGSGSNRGHFLDYYHDSSFPQVGSDSPIEYDHEYRYAAARYIDLGPALQGDARYLVSQASTSTAFAAPPLPSWQIAKPVVSYTPETSLVAPILRVHIKVIDERGLGELLGSRMGFATEIVRMLDSTLVATGSDLHEIAIGKPIELEVAAPSGPASANGTVALDRIGRDYPSHAPTLQLRLKVGQFLKGASTDKLALDQRVLNASVSIPPPPPNFPGEMVCDVEWKIIVG